MPYLLNNKYDVILYTHKENKYVSLDDRIKFLKDLLSNSNPSELFKFIQNKLINDINFTIFDRNTNSGIIL